MCVFLFDLLTFSGPLLSCCRYAIVFVYIHTRMLWIKPLAAKLDMLQLMQEWIASVNRPPTTGFLDGAVASWLLSNMVRGVSAIGLCGQPLALDFW
jgi:hypothetical protein